MMVLIDTSVWIDFFSSKPSPHVNQLDTLINEEYDICICGIVLTEVLQGIKYEREYQKTKEFFKDLIFLPMHYSTYLKSAEIYRNIRKKGITIRRVLDCLIASVAVENNVLILHNDKDFLQIAKHSKLKILSSKIA